MNLKTKSFGIGQLNSKTTSNTYFINEHPFSLPVVALSFNNDFFYDPLIGLHVKGINGSEGPCNNIANWNQDWERAVFFEYFDANGVKQISQSAGVKVSGNCTRGRDQKSLSIYARDKYDDDDFDYLFFKNKPNIKKENSILLRNSGNDQDLTLLRDAFTQELIRGSLDVDYQSYQPVIVYFNNEYRGLMNIREKTDEDYFNANYHIKNDAIDFFEKDLYLLSGNSDDAIDLSLFIIENDLSIPQNYNFIQSKVDINSFIDYFAAEVYIGNTDWPQNNIKYWKPKAAYGKWRWLLFDTDYGFGFRRTLPDVASFDRLSTATDFSSNLFNALMKNKSFSDTFYSKLMTVMHTTFSPFNCSMVLDTIAKGIETEIEFNQIKFNRTKAQWDNEIEKLRTQTAQRHEYMKKYMEGFVDMTQTSTLKIKNNEADKGHIKLNEVITKNFPITLTTSSSLPLKVEAIPSKGFQFDHWIITDSIENKSFNSKTLFYNQAINIEIEPKFVEVQQLNNIVINEIASEDALYNDIFNENTGFIELYNKSEDDLILNGCFLSDKADNYGRFSIPDSTVIKAKSHLVYYTDGNSLKGNNHTNFILNNEGESIFLTQKTGTKIIILDEANLPFGLNLSHSFGRNTDGDLNWEVMQPTPNSQNIGLNSNYADLLHQAEEIKTFPNPCKGDLNIHISNIKNLSYNCNIVDLTGNVLMSSLQLSDYFNTISLSSLPNGIYFIQIINKQTIVATRKIILQK